MPSLSGFVIDSGAALFSAIGSQHIMCFSISGSPRSGFATKSGWCAPQAEAFTLDVPPEVGLVNK
jgi:hypothetical protein